MGSWNSRYETGNPVVDRDHQALFGQIDALGEALKTGTAKTQLVQMVTFLNRYVREHFAREEGIMRAVSCPATGQNCTAHKALVRQLDGWVTRLNSEGATTSLVLEIYNESSGWLRAHIVGVDCQLRQCRAA